MVDKWTVGFAFNETCEHCLLVRKKRPEFLAGKLNGIGGNIETGETPLECMQREFKEETGLEVNNWKQFCRLNTDHGSIVFFAAKDREANLSKFNQSLIDEELQLLFLRRLQNVNPQPNLLWLIPMAINCLKGRLEFYEITEEMP